MSPVRTLLTVFEQVVDDVDAFPSTTSPWNDARFPWVASGGRGTMPEIDLRHISSPVE